MTGRLETLIYTDCRPDQGLSGTAGLQFQARSPGADRDAMEVVRRNLLYEPPSAWMRERRPPADYPPSFAHVWDGCLATARGVYLGKEANGGREGNQLTHSVVASAPEAYALVRPAQMFQAPFWTDRPAAGTECPAVDEGWQPGPFDAVAAQGFVTGHPHGPRLLVSLLSALQRVGEDQAPRILFVAREVEPVLRWLTAATLLLPQRRALAVGFKVFTTNPAYATQPVLAVHPDWEESPVQVDDDRGYAVFDLETGAWSQVEPSGTAARWVSVFCAEDPYDVVDAVEVADATNLPDAAGQAVGLAAVLHRRPRTDEAEAVVSWLRTGSPKLLDEYGAVVADLFVESVHEWTPAVLRDLDTVARTGRLPERAVEVRQALLTAEVNHARRTGKSMTQPLEPTAGWTADDQAHAVRTVLHALRDADPRGFDAVLRVARRFRLPVSGGHLRELAGGFLADWAAHPERDYSPADWPCGDDLRDMLRDELARRVESDPDGVGDLWWERLLDTVDHLGSGLNEAVLSAAMARLPRPGRRSLASRWLAGLARVPEPAKEARYLSDVLWRRVPPTDEEFRLLLDKVPAEAALSPRIFSWLGQQLQDEPSATALDLAQELVGRGLFRPPDLTAELLRRDRALLGLCQELVSGTQRKGVPVPPAVPTALVRARKDTVIQAVAEAPRPWVEAMLREFPELIRGYVEAVSAAIRKHGRPATVVTAFYLASMPRSDALGSRLDDDLRVALNKSVLWWMAVASSGLLERAKVMADDLGKSCGRAWRTQLDKVALRRRATIRRRSWDR